MENKNAKSRMQGLFANYHSLLSQQGVKWIIEDNQNLAVTHVLSATRPQSLRERLESDLSFSHHALKKDFKEFLKHAVKLSEAFQTVDNGPKKKKKLNDANRSGNPGENPPDKNKDKNREQPLCLWEPHRKAGLRHLLRHCKECPPEEKKRIREQIAKEKAKTGPAKSPRAQIAQQAEQEKHKKDPPKIAARISNQQGTAACQITLKDDSATLPCVGRCDDGADESIVSPQLAESAVLSGIGKMKKIKPVTVQAALKESREAQTFTLSREWTVPRLLLHLSVGPLALLNISLLVADAELAENDLLIGQPVLKHLGMDSKTMLENNRAQLNETDCSTVVKEDQVSSTVGRVLIARIKGKKNNNDSHDYGEKEKSTVSS